EKLPVTVVAEPVSNTVLVSASQDQIQQVLMLIEKIDQAPPSVQMDLLVVQVPADFMEKAGLRGADASDARPCELTDRERQMFHALLRQARQEGTVKFLSEPRLMVLDNQTGYIQVGGHHPCPTLAADGKPAQVEMVPVGLCTRVTPRISPDGKVLVRIENTIT